MNGFGFGEVVAIVGIAVPVIAFVWEFVLVGRKRLGWRVQMDTPITGEVESTFPGALTHLRPDPEVPLEGLSIVLLRVENDGTTTIDENDYRVLHDVPAGLCVKFPQRSIVGYAVTELSDPGLASSFNRHSGIRTNYQGSAGILDLPRVPLNRRDHYKVLVILRSGADSAEFPRIEVVGQLKGGRVHETESHTRPSRWNYVLVLFLVVVITVQLGFSLFEPRSVPLDCVAGQLALTGSTAFSGIVTEVADSYGASCPGAQFHTDFQDSSMGLDALDEAGRKAADPNFAAMLAISDSPKHEGLPQLLPRPIAFTLFTLVVNPDAGVQDLSTQNIRDLFAGKITNWKQIRGNDAPVHLIGRPASSGTREIFQKRVLGPQSHGDSNSADCRNITEPNGTEPLRCDLPTTDKVLETVAATSGALGYGELGSAVAHRDVLQVRIDGHKADLDNATHGAYPFWSTEYAYSYGNPPAKSLAASFLRYFTDQVGRDILRAHGDTPCSELANPALCSPDR